MALKLNLNRDKIVGQDSEKKESTLIQPRIKLSMAEPAAVETNKPKSYGPTISERENSVIGQLATDSKMAYRSESRDDNSLWKQTEKDRIELDKYTEKLMQDLSDQLTKYRADNDTDKIAETQKHLTELQKQTDTHWTDRVGNTVVGALRQSAGATGSAFAVTTEDMLDGGRKNVRGESMDKLSFDKNKALQYTQGVRDKTMALTQSGAADIEQAKKGLGTVGRLAVDTAAGLTQLGADIGIGAVTGLGAMPVLAVRAFGGAADQAKMDGASVDQQVAYGLASATVELATEKLFSANIISSKAFGKGAADDLLTGIVAGLEDVASTPNGRAMMNRVGTMLTSGLSEGLEEGIAAVVEPISAKLAYGKDMDWDAKEIGYQVLIGALTGAITGISGQNTNEYRAKVAGHQVGQSIKDSGNLSGIVRQALHTDKESAAYKKADEIRSRKTPATNQEITELARLTFTQVAKEQAEQAAAVEKAQSADLGQPVSTKTATVLDTGTSAYVALGMKTKRAEAKAKVVQKLINGEEVSLDGMKSLNLTDAKYREIFTQLTGVVFPEGMTNQDQLINIAKTANTVSRVEQVDPGTPVNVQTEVQEPIAQDIAQDIAQVSDDAQPLSYEQFGEAYRRTEGADLSIDEPTMRSVYDSYLEHENQTVMESGAPVTRTQFRSNMRKTEAGAKMSDREIDRYFDSYRESQTEAPKDLRHKLSKDVQDVIAAFEKKLGIRIEVTESIRSEKTGQTAEGVSDPGVIRLALDARGDLSYDEAVMQVLRHEVTHQLKRAVSEDTYNAFAKYVREFDSEFYQTQYDKVSNTYAEQFKDADDAEKQAAIDEEVIARCAEKLFEDEAFIRMVVGKNRTLAEKIHDVFEKLLKKLNLTGEAKKQLQTKRDLWAAMLNEAEENVKAGVAYDKETESFHPAQFSLDTWNESDYVAARAEAAKAMSEALGITQKKAKDYIDSVNSIAKMIANDRVRLDYEASPGRSSFVSNAEYGGSIDFSTICKKRRLFTGTFEAIQRALPNTALTAEEFLEIRSMMDEKGYEVSCGLCYVEGSRAKMGQYTKQFIERYAATNPEYVPTMAEMNTATGQEQIRREHPEVYEAYERFMNNYGRLSPTDKAIFASQQKPKMYQMSTAYQGEILNKFGRKSSKVTEKNLNGGLRIQSFSDFEIIHLIDMMQVIMDMSRVGLSGQAYTKVPDFAWALGDTGLKINLSLITKGLDENGKLILDEKEGMSAADAFALRDRYSENVGTILVVYTDDQLKAALADDRIDYIIPFHKSQWKMDQYELMGIPAEAKNFNYEKLQNESYIKPVLKNGKKQRPENFMPNTYWDFSKSGKENAETYLRMCAEDNRRPKFHHLLVDNKDGSYTLQPDGSTDGYWKLLIDFKMYDNDGKGVPQRPVRPDFNMEQAYRMLADYKGGHSRFPAADDVVSEFVEQYKRNHPGEQLSLADEYVGTNPELAYLPWENQVDLALSGKFNDLIRSDGYTEDGKRLNSVLYVAKEPTALLQEAGLSDLPLIMTQQHLRSIVSQRWDSENPDRVVNWHNHEIDPELVKKVPEFIRKPVAIFKSEGKQVGGLVILTSEFDSHGNPICVFINPDQPSFTYDGAVGPAHFVNMYGLEKFDQFLQRAIDNEGIIYQDKKMGQHPAVRDTQTKGVSSGEGLTSAYNTIVRQKDPTVKPGERQYSLTDEADSTGTHFLSEGQLEYFKDSKVRDKQGRLLRLYHGTDAFGFTKLDMSKADDGRSFFMTDSPAVAKTYSGTYEMRSVMDADESEERVDPFKAPIEQVAEKLMELAEDDFTMLSTKDQITDWADNHLYWARREIKRTFEMLDKFLKMDTSTMTGQNRADVEEAQAIFRRYHEAFKLAEEAEFNPLALEVAAEELNIVHENEIEEGVDSPVFNNIYGKTLLTGLQPFEIIRDLRQASRALRIAQNGEIALAAGNEYIIGESDIREALDVEYKVGGYGGEANYELYANLTNPLVVECDEALWRSIHIPEELAADGFHEIAGIMPDRRTAKTRNFAQYAQARGYDGVIFREVEDDGPADWSEETSTVVVAFNSNQVKDANNLNPTEDPDLRYSFADEVAYIVGGSYNTTGKYWKPDFGQAEWNLWNRTVKREVNTTDQYVIDDSTKWLYAEEKGVRVFGLYSTNDPEDPTLLYASKGVTAQKERTQLKKALGLEDKADEGYRDYQARGEFARIVEAVKSEQSSKNHDLYETHRGSTAAGDVRVSSGERGSDRGADPVEVQADPQLSLADDLTPEKRKAFIETFDAEFGEGAAEQMFKAHDQMARAAARAEKRAAKAEESKTAAETLAKEKSERDLTAFLMYHNRKLREQQRKYNGDKAKLQKAKAEAVKEAVETTKLVERAKADIRVQATEMHLGKKAAEQKRTGNDKIAELKAEAADRLRVTKKAYRDEMSRAAKLQRNAAKHLLSDKKAVERRKNEIQTAQGPVNTIRQNPRERVKVEKMKALAQELRTRGRTAYRYFVNQAQEIDNFAKRQKGGIYASTLVNVLGGSSSTVESIFKNGLVDRSGNRIGESLKDVLLCMDETGKKVDEAKQALLQDYILHLHNIDRMSFVAKAKARLDAFEGNPENAWLVGLDGKDLAMLVAATDKETADAIFDKYGKVKKGKSGWTEADRQLAWEYASLLHDYREAQDKPVFADENGSPVTADTSREIVAKYEKDNAWLIDKANGIFEWWDLFMRNWAVGDSLSLSEYETMHETYPHYAPTYRVDKAGPGGAVSVSGTAATVGKATKAAKGSTLEIVPIEDSFANIASKIVRLARVNELYMNIIDTAMLDEEGLFSDMAVFDWDWQSGEYEQALQLQAILNGETEAEIEESTKTGLEKIGANYKLTGWSHGRKYSAWISEDLYKSIADTTGATDEQLKKLTKLGNTLTGPMKTAITGINPFFAIRNLSRDIPSAIINSTGGKFPKYWAQAIAEMKSNSENWQAFQALGGTHAGYYNNEKGFVDAMAKRPGVVKTAIEGLGWINNVTESATRFAEYLSTIDRMGDTYEARLQGIKNSAEVTVDFSRKGSYGKFINAWVPYWNPAVQGIDKMIRSVIDSPDGSAVWKQATKTLGRAATQTILFEAILQAVLHALDRDDEWEKLSDRDKAAYYCIPLWDEHKFLKIAKNREWGAILGTPFMLILEGLDGRQNPFENYVETALEPNFLPGAILRPREGGGFTSDVIGVSQALDLAYNEDFAGRTIIPYALQQGSKTEQYDSETSRLSVALGKLINFSPMQIDYIVKDYFGDFGELFTGLTAPGTYEVAPEQALKNAWDTFTGSFHTDNRYSNQTVSTYYETLDELGKVVNDKKNQMGTEAHKQTKEYKTQKGLQEMYGNRITELNKEVRGLPDGPDKDALKEEIAQLAGLAMDFYKQAMSGEIKEPLLTVTYANLPESVSNELIRLDSFAKDYAFEPTNNTTSKYTDPEDKQREYILDDESKEKRSEIYSRTYGEVMGEIMNKSEYRKANDQKKVEMLEEARDSVAKLTKDEFLDWLAANRRSTLKK